MPPRLPILGSDSDRWGSLLNEFLRVEHREDGTLKTAIPCVPSIAALRGRAPAPDQCVLVAGYYAPSDGGGGRFHWDAASTESDNGGTIIAPASNPASGRWRRAPEPVLSVKAFGARGDGLHDATAAIQAAIDSLAPAGGTICFPPGVYRVTSPIRIVNANVTLLGSPGISGSIADELGSVIRFEAAQQTADDNQRGALEIEPAAPGDNVGARLCGLHLKRGGIETAHNGVLIRSAANVILGQCYIHSFGNSSGGAGVALDRAIVVTIADCTIQGNRIGVETVGAAGQYNNRIRIQGGRIFQNGRAELPEPDAAQFSFGYGSDLSGAGIAIIGVNLEGQPNGLRLGNHSVTAGATIEGCYFEGNWVRPITLGGGGWVFGVTISGSYFYANATRLLFHIGSNYVADLDKADVTNVRSEFKEQHNVALSAQVQVVVRTAGSEWLIDDRGYDITYAVRNEQGVLNVYACPTAMINLIACGDFWIAGNTFSDGGIITRNLITIDHGRNGLIGPNSNLTGPDGAVSIGPGTEPSPPDNVAYWGRGAWIVL